MAGATLTFSLRNIERLTNRIERLARAQYRQLLGVIGGTITSQTQRRISSEKTAPDGTRWPQWGDATAAQRHGNQSLLFASGALAADIHFQVRAAAVDIGSNLAYAATHQFGDDRTIQVPGHQRTITQAFGKPIKATTVDVKAHSVKRDIPAREYLGVSPANETELIGTIDRFLDRMIESNLKGLPA